MYISLFYYEGGNVMDRGKFIDISSVGSKGQIVIPKAVRNMFNIKTGDSIVVFCDNDKGISLVKSDEIHNLTINNLKNSKEV